MTIRRIGAPAEGLPANGFSARWTKRETFEAGAYRFLASANDGGWQVEYYEQTGSARARVWWERIDGR